VLPQQILHEQGDGPDLLSLVSASLLKEPISIGLLGTLAFIVTN
jgi:hypothetical protein